MDIIAGVLALSYSRTLMITPSAGALYPCQLDLLFRHEGVWQQAAWCAESHAVRVTQPVRSTTRPALAFALDSDDILGGSSVLVVVGGDLAATSGKYANRSYRYVLLEAGHIAQMIHLAAVAYELGSLEWGAFRDEALASLVGLAEPIAPLVVLGLGVPDARKAPSQTSHGMRAALRDWHRRASGGEAKVVRSEPRPARGPAGFVVIQHRRSTNASGGLSTGVGWTTVEAETRALAEAVERDATRLVRWDCVGTERDLERPLAFDPTALFPPDSVGFSNSDRYEPYVPSRVREWRHARSASGAEFAVPVELVYFEGPCRVLSRPLCAVATSSGVAAARTSEIARDAALAELVERDAYVRCWIGREPPRVWTTPPAWFKATCDWLEAEGYAVSVHVFENAALPTVGVAINGSELPALSWGMASRDEPEEALTKAYHEAAASWVTARRDSRPPDTTESDWRPADHARQYFQRKERAKVDWFFAGRALTHERSTVPRIEWESLRATAFFVDITPDDSPVCVVRALSPKLRPLWFGSRWKPTDDTNEVPHFFS